MGTRSATFKHGRYSRCLPTALAKRYHAARRDPALLELRDGIALTDARICELLGMREIAWPDVLNALNVQRRLIAAECRRMHEQSRYVPVDEALSLVGAIVASVRAVCTDEQIAVVQNDVRRLLLLRTNS